MYEMCGNNPHTFSDMLGLDSCVFTGGTVAFFANKPSWDVNTDLHGGASVVTSLTIEPMDIVEDGSECSDVDGCKVALRRNAVHMTGTWWSLLTSYNAKYHEKQHQTKFRTQGRDELIAYARSKEGCYKTREAAECWKSVVEGVAVDKFLVQGILRSHELDATGIYADPNYTVRHAALQTMYNTQSVTLMAGEQTCGEMQTSPLVPW